MEQVDFGWEGNYPVRQTGQPASEGHEHEQLDWTMLLTDGRATPHNWVTSPTWGPPGGGGGDSLMKQTGMLVGNFEFNP